MTVIKIMARKKNREVWPKRLTCWVGLIQTEETMFARTKIIRGIRAGEVVKWSLPRVRFLIHQAISETVPTTAMKKYLLKAKKSAVMGRNRSGVTILITKGTILSILVEILSRA